MIKNFLKSWLSNILLLPSNFDESTVNFIKYSMPTKLPAYMISEANLGLWG